MAIYWCDPCFDASQIEDDGDGGIKHLCTDPQCACRAWNCTKEPTTAPRPPSLKKFFAEYGVISDDELIDIAMSGVSDEELKLFFDKAAQK